MSNYFACWCCEEKTSPLFTKGFGTTDEIKICGSCIGTLASIEARLTEITRSGKLADYLTAKDLSVPICEREEINSED
jgi:uncharacterized protein CbrC (UPF0167 family)